jgi:hypothetical protein
MGHPPLFWLEGRAACQTLSKNKMAKLLLVVKTMWMSRQESDCGMDVPVSAEGAG